MNRTIDRADIVYQRLDNQRLTFSDFKKPVDVVKWLGAVQAQDFNGAKWAIAQRTIGTTDALIQRAFDQGKILRTHVLRPTWHFVRPKDIRWMLRLTANRIHSGLVSTYRTFELNDDIFKKCNRTLVRALKGGKHLTRASLKKILIDAGIPADNSIRLGFLLLHAEQDEVICSGPRVDNQLTYALLDERVPQYQTLDRDEALDTLARRFFVSHGPATLQDFIWWSGLKVADAKNAFAMVERDLTKTLCDEKSFWGPASNDSSQRKTSLAHLLPSFDEYTVAYKNRTAICDLDQTKLSEMAGGLLGPVVLIDGKVVGSWKVKTNEQSITTEVRSFKRLNKVEKLEIKKAADRYATYRDIRATQGIPIFLLTVPKRPR